MFGKFLIEFYTLYFVWLAGLVAIFKLSKPLPAIYRWFCAFVILLAIMETVGNAIGFFGKRSNHFFFNIHYAVVFSVVPVFYASWLRSAVFKRLLYPWLILVLSFAVINMLWIQSFYKLNTYTYILGSSCIIILCIAYLWELYTDERVQNIIRNPEFWISLAFLIYFAVSVPYFGMLNYLLRNHARFAELYYEIVMDGTICLYNILIIIGLLWMKPTK